ncbi:Ltp family lipoprotein [Arthrobacter jiangjiafuii]|uniref:Ltp family lipoprotein n=1 Tax=Arthrobacter jiangjiafuii TaxID=2817475 RepID=UPI001F2B7966|nr:Ltp family lipoprotein [Arthrobacter jiangjiafuii]
MSTTETSYMPMSTTTSKKSFVVTWLLALLLGGLGIDRFYLGKIGTGVLKLLTFGGFGIWTLVDLIITLTGNQKDKNGQPLAGYQENKKIAWIVTAVVWILNVVVSMIMLFSGVLAIGSAIENSPSLSQSGGGTVQEAPAPADSEAPAADTSVPKEYQSALTQANSYAKMSLSKAGIFDQLTSEYGGKFTPEAAQYAVDNVDADFNANALKSAQVFQDDMAMSPDSIRDQLTSEYGSKFTAEEADYAIQNLK